MNCMRALTETLQLRPTLATGKENYPALMIRCAADSAIPITLAPSRSPMNEGKRSDA